MIYDGTNEIYRGEFQLTGFESFHKALQWMEDRIDG
jgi:hypothetical protein